jgi:hypothetical protein
MRLHGNAALSLNPSSRYGRIASRASGAIGVVAL